MVLLTYIPNSRGSRRSKNILVFIIEVKDIAFSMQIDIKTEFMDFIHLQLLVVLREDFRKFASAE